MRGDQLIGYWLSWRPVCEQVAVQQTLSWTWISVRSIEEDVSVSQVKSVVEGVVQHCTVYMCTMYINYGNTAVCIHTCMIGHTTELM